MVDAEVLDDLEIEDDVDTSALDEDEATEEPAKPAKAPKPVAKAAAKKATKTAKPAKAAVKPAKPAAKKEAKPKAAAKKGALDNDDEDKRDLPFKRKSVMRFCLTQALKGIKVSALEQKLKDNGYNVGFQMKMLRSGQSNGKGLMPYPVTHTWTITEDKGIIKAHNVKRIATYDKLERVYATKKSETKKAKTAATKKQKAKATKKK